MKDILLFGLYKFGQFLSLNLPLKGIYWIAERAADLQCTLAVEERRRVKKNLSVILKEKRNVDLDKLTRRVYRNFGKYLADFFRFSLIDKTYIEKSIKIKGLENINKAFEAKKGVIVLTAHLGNWELGGVVMAVLGYPFNAVALAHRNKLVNDLFIRQRTRKGVKVIPLGFSVRRIFNDLSQNELVALLGDRDFSARGLHVDFFKQKAQVPRGPATIALKTGAPIVPGFMVRDRDGRFLLMFEQSIWIEPTGDGRKDVLILTKKYLKVIEAYIRRYPEQWFMFVDFWKKENSGGSY